MRKYKLPALKREQLTKGTTNSLRNKGIVPGVIYDKSGSTPVSVFINDLKPVVHTTYTYNITIDLEGEEHQTIIQDVQFHPVSDEIIHVDFYRISPDIPIKTRIPVTCIGNPAGVKEGGRFLQKIRKMVVRGKPKDLPDEIRVDVANLELGESVKVADLMEDNIELLDSPANPVCTVSVPRSMKAKGILEPGEVAEGAEEAEEAEGGGETAAETSEETPKEGGQE